MNIVSTAVRTATRTVPGLPSVRLSDTQRRQRNVANPRLGRTQTRLGGTRSGASSVMGQPSMRLLDRAGGGVVTELRRMSQWTDYAVEEDLRPIRQEMDSEVRMARSLSRGPLNTARLRRMGHPYGRGRRAGLGRLQRGRVGISNMAVVNRQSGQLERSWDGDLERSKNGLTLRLSNSAPQSRWVARGTRKMKSHGPFTVMARRIPTINRLHATAMRRAQNRAMQLEKMAQEGGMQ